jgi:DNA-binding YbaB/EbfC family protein
MKNLGNLMKQAQELQSKMAAVQAELEAMEIAGQSGGGLVTVTLTGKGDMKAVAIDPSLAKPDEVEILEDLIAAAHADAKARMERMVADKMKEVTGNLPLPPGMNLGF